MSLPLTQLGLGATPDGNYSVTSEAAGLAEGTSSATTSTYQDLTTLGLYGGASTTPLHNYQAVLDTGVGVSAGSSVVQATAVPLFIGAGVADGTSTATADSIIAPTYTTLGIGGFSSTSPLLDYLTSDTGEGLAQGSSTAEAFAENAVIEDIGTPDTWYLGQVLSTGAGTIGQQSASVTPTGGMTFGGTGSAAKGFICTATGGLSLRGTVAAVKSRTVTPNTASRLTFSGTGAPSQGVTQSFSYTPSGGIQFSGNPTLSFFKDYGPGATGKIRDKRRLTFSTRAYSRG